MKRLALFALVAAITVVLGGNAEAWTEQQKLTASDATEGDVFGGSVSVDGDTAVIGAVLDDDAG